MNLTELRTQIHQYIEEYEASFTANTDTFIRQAEQRIMNSLINPLPTTRTDVNGTLGIGVETVAVPANFLSPLSLRITVSGRHRYLINKDLTFLYELFPDGSTAAPELYAQQDETSFIVRPVPDSAYDYRLTYFARADSILETVSETSWLGDNFDSVLLYGALCAAALYIKAPEALQTYNNAFVEHMALLKTLIDGKNEGDRYRRGQQVAAPTT